jgi:hypothetical protein
MGLIKVQPSRAVSQTGVRLRGSVAIDLNNVEHCGTVWNTVVAARAYLNVLG